MDTKQIMFNVVTPKKTTPKKQANGTFKVVTPRKQKEAAEPLTQKFFISHGEKSLTIKISDMSFGIRHAETGIESHTKNTLPKDNETIQSILKVIKDYRKHNVSFADISDRLEKCLMCQSIRSFLNQLNKPEIEVPAIAEPA